MKSAQVRQIPLDSRQLNAFVTLARTGSFKATAGELFLTHSAISHAMSALEREIGCRLLTRMGRKVELTEMGEVLLRHAQGGLREFAKGREAIETLRNWGVTQLRVGADAAVSRQLLPIVFHEARLEYPRLRITARIVRPWETVSRLAEEGLDLVLGEQQRTIPEIAFAPLFESPLRVAVSATHRWAEQGRITPGELAREPCLLASKSHPTSQLIDRYFADDQIELNSIAEMDSFDVIKEMVRSGTAISVLPLWVMAEELDAGLLAEFPLGRRPLIQSWGLYRWRSRPLAKAENSFHNLCKATALKMIRVTCSRLTSSR